MNAYKATKASFKIKVNGYTPEQTKTFYSINWQLNFWKVCYIGSKLAF